MHSMHSRMQESKAITSSKQDRCDQSDDHQSTSNNNNARETTKTRYQYRADRGHYLPAVDERGTPIEESMGLSVGVLSIHCFIFGMHLSTSTTESGRNAKSQLDFTLVPKNLLPWLNWVALSSAPQVQWAVWARTATSHVRPRSGVQTEPAL